MPMHWTSEQKKVIESFFTIFVEEVIRSTHPTRFLLFQDSNQSRQEGWKKERVVSYVWLGFPNKNTKNIVYLCSTIQSAVSPVLSSLSPHLQKHCPEPEPEDCWRQREETLHTPGALARWLACANLRTDVTNYWTNFYQPNREGENGRQSSDNLPIYLNKW